MKWHFISLSHLDMEKFLNKNKLRPENIKIAAENSVYLTLFYFSENEFDRPPVPLLAKDQI